MIEVVNLNKSFGDVSVLHDININIEKGEKVVVIGPSGSGKSTFLRCLNCMEDPTSGSIIFNGVDIADMKVDINIHRQKMGMVFQHFNLFNNKTVIENIMLAPVYVEKKRMKKLRRNNPENEKIKSTKEIKADAQKQAMELLKRIGLEDKADAYPSQLSGGQKQRVAIARALMLNPDILCFDEPTSALDPELTGEVLKVIRELRDSERTMIIVTHEMDFARKVSDKIMFMSEGIAAAYGTPEELFSGNGNERLSSFLNAFDK